jgi:hypothetical protein
MGWNCATKPLQWLNFASLSWMLFLFVALPGTTSRASRPAVLATEDDGTWDPNTKFDLVCYSASTECEENFGGMEGAMPPNIVSVVIATPSNLKSKLAAATANVMIASFMHIPSNENQDVVDLSVFGSPKTLELFKAADAGEESRHLPRKKARQVPPGISRGGKSTGLRPLAGRRPKDSYQSMVLVGGANARGAVRYLMPTGYFTIADSLSVQSIHLGAAYIENPDKITTGYALTYGYDLWEGDSSVLQINFEELGVVSGVEKFISKIRFTETGWEFSEAGYSGYNSLSYERFQGKKLSLLYLTSWMDDDPAIEGTLEHADGVTEVPGIKLTVQFDVRVSVAHLMYGGEEWARRNRELAGVELKVTFGGQWSAVTNKPTLIFQTPNQEQVTFLGDVPPDDKVTIVKADSPDASDPSGGQGNNNPDTGDDDGGLGTGPIVGIAVGAVALVAIVAVLVWFLVIRPSKGDGASA